MPTPKKNPPKRKRATDWKRKRKPKLNQEQREMALLYEKAFNEIVNKMADWRRDIMIGEFDIDKKGKRIYPSTRARQVHEQTAHEVAKLAERWAYDKYNK
tara:strand:+ start:119 stop:418 length:300 start_codon:yes stop_codon:yes gene_type:complete